MGMQDPPKMDLVFITDSTGSMGNFLTSLTKSIGECSHMCRISNIIDRVGVMEYKDYCDSYVTRWSGWAADAKQLCGFINALEPSGGGDWPEAAKTAAFELLQHVSGSSSADTKKTIVIWYADAGPHADFTKKSRESNIQKEKAKLGDQFDWVVLCKALAQAGMMVFPMVTNNNIGYTQHFFALMAHYTSGQCFVLSNTDSKAISQNTISLILSLIGQACTFTQAEITSLRVTDHIKVESQLLVVCQQCPPVPADSAAIPSLTDHVASLLRQFETDPVYRATVYDVFEYVLEPDLIKSITYNPLFGTFWRAICKDRANDRRTILLNKLSTTVSSLHHDDKMEMQAFIDESYCQGEVVTAMIAACPQQFPAVVLDIPAKMSNKEILEVTRSCCAQVLARMGTFITGLRQVNSAEEAGGATYLPLAMPDKDFFSCLPHLIKEGIMFSLRGSVLLAMLVARTSAQLLLPKALSFLTAIKGRWIDVSLPENFSYEFVKLVLHVHKAMDGALLTEEEEDRYKLLHTVGGLKLNEHTTLLARQAFTSNKTKRPDRKTSCTKCDQPRSFTLLTTSGVCGICYRDDGDDDDDDNDGDDGTQTLCTDTDASYWCECSTCAVHYAVERVSLLTWQPKCHFCRKGLQAPKVRCAICTNAFVSCGNVEPVGEAVSGWVCPPCAAVDGPGGVADQEVEVTLRDYMAADNSGFLGFTVVDADSFFCKSLWNVYNARDTILGPAASAGGDGTGAVQLRRKLVTNVPELREEVQRWVRLERGEAGTCMLCFEDVNKRQLFPVCGRKRCSTVACGACLQSWYGEPQPGHNLNLCNLLCPFCKHAPSVKVLKRYNRQACTLKRGEVEPGWHWAWCLDCYTAKPHVERACAGDAEVPIVQQFRCEDCRRPGEGDIEARTCPACGVMVQKTSGCDHISCQCGAHWCYVCGKEENADLIYDHMWEAHGGIGLEVGEDDQEYLDEWEDDEEYLHGLEEH